MEYIEIEGGRELSGEIVLSGSKNSALPILACSLLSDKRLQANIGKAEFLEPDSSISPDNSLPPSISIYSMTKF